MRSPSGTQTELPKRKNNFSIVVRGPTVFNRKAVLVVAQWLRVVL